MGWARDLGRTGRRRRVVRERPGGRWSVQASLPLSLCDVALIVAAIACWWPQWNLAVELTYFWELAGTLQAVVTPDLSAGFPQLEFFMFVVGHLGIVVAALFLVVGLRLRPRPGSVTRVFAITAAYTAFVGWFDWVTGSNYMFLAAVPRNGSLLSVLGPWPWYILSAAGGRPCPAADPGCAVSPPQAPRTEPGRESATGPAPARTVARRKRWTLTARTGRTTTFDGRGLGRVRVMPWVDHRWPIPRRTRRHAHRGIERRSACRCAT
jgi:Integral membrane protein (intg_mem_TP0381)